MKSSVKSYSEIPVIAAFPSGDHPPIPTGLKVSCSVNPDTLEECDKCPVIVWNNYVYWAYSYRDNRVGLAIVAYELNGEFVRQWDMKGTRYIYKITSDADKKNITFWGQANDTIEMGWDELYLMKPPVEGRIPTSAHPKVPSGLKVSCKDSPETLDPSSSCPVIQWNGYTYWAFSYYDNRVALNIAAFDVAGKLVKQWEKKGTRYVYDINVDVVKQTVTFLGQSNDSVVMTWHELVI